MHGVSTRAVDDLVRAMGGGGVSKSQVSRLCADIDERVGAFLTRPIEGRWPYLWLDATYLKVREDGVRACPRTGGGHALTVSRAVIVAVAVNEDGRREVLGIATGPSEAEVFWTEFLRGLADRGLCGVKLVIADDHKGLRAAAGRVAGRDVSKMPRALGQERAVPRSGQTPRRGLSDAQDHLRPRQNKAAAVKQWDEVACALRPRHPRLGEMMDASREDVLAYMDFPREHWPRDSPRPIPSSASTARSSAAPTWSASSRTTPPSSASRVRSCLRPATSGPPRDATCRWKPSPASCKLTPSVCQPRQPDRLGPPRRPALLHHPVGHDRGDVP